MMKRIQGIRHPRKGPCYSHSNMSSSKAWDSGLVMWSSAGMITLLHCHLFVDCLSRLGRTPFFISAMGKDEHSESILRYCSHMVGHAVTASHGNAEGNFGLGEASVKPVGIRANSFMAK